MKRLRAFTLFEVLTSIAIFLLLAGGIFASVRAAFTASVQVANSQLESERDDAFQQLIRRFFQSLPADARLELRLRKQAGRGDVVELLAWPVADFLRFGTDANDGVALTGLPDGRGNFRFSLGYFRAADPPEKRDRQLDQAKWLTLLPDVKQIRWRLAAARNPVLVDSWNAGSGRPGLAELTLVMADGSGSTSTYWIPPLQRRPAATAEPGDPANPARPPQGAGGQPQSAPPEGEAPAPPPQ